MIGAAHKAAADVGAATAAKMITVQVVTRQTSDNVHMALKRTKYAAAAAANKAAVAGWNVRIGTVAYMPMDNNSNTIDAAVAAANTVAFVRRTNDRKRVSITYHCQILWLQLFDRSRVRCIPLVRCCPSRDRPCGHNRAPPRWTMRACQPP